MNGKVQLSALTGLVRDPSLVRGRYEVSKMSDGKADERIVEVLASLTAPNYGFRGRDFSRGSLDGLNTGIG
jgi:hypothetical protein